MKGCTIIFNGYVYRYSNFLWNHPPSVEREHFRTLSTEQVEKFRELIGDLMPEYPGEYCEFDAETGECLSAWTQDE